MTAYQATVTPARLTGARQARGWTQAELADAAGVDETAIRQAETTGDGLTHSDVAVIADLLGVRRPWLLGRDTTADRVRRAASVQI